MKVPRLKLISAYEDNVRYSRSNSPFMYEYSYVHLALLEAGTTEVRAKKRAPILPWVPYSVLQHTYLNYLTRYSHHPVRVRYLPMYSSRYETLDLLP